MQNHFGKKSLNVKFSFSEKATKTSKPQERLCNFCGLLRKAELYSDLKNNLNKMNTNQDKFVYYSLKKEMPLNKK